MPLRILHVLRAPVGGLFRHVTDLSREQIARGHQVGIIADADTGGAIADEQFNSLKPSLALGLLRVPIRRAPHFSDISALLAVSERVRETRPDVVHGHGSKGGAFARSVGLFAGPDRPAFAYTPHGGSLNYRPGSMAHRFFMLLERALAYRTDVLLFESAFIADRFHEFVGEPRCLERVVVNGVSPAEFEPVRPAENAADFLYVGEFRAAKGLDTLVDALALLASRDHLRPTLVLVGDGPEKAAIVSRAESSGVAQQLTFCPPSPVREAFTRGRTMVLPSRFESLPYIVLEAASAQIPLVSTDVGGLPEIFGPYADRLIACDNPQILADALRAALAEPDEGRAKAAALHDFIVSRFTIDRMVDDILGSYSDALAARAKQSTAALP